MTDSLSWAKCKTSNINLYVADTPGIDKTNNIISLALRRALRSLEWNLVVIMAKMDSRFEDNTLSQLRMLSRPFRNDMDRVVFIISHLDILDKQDSNNITTK